jgi:hypothetical protein
MARVSRPPGGPWTPSAGPDSDTQPRRPCCETVNSEKPAARPPTAAGAGFGSNRLPVVASPAHFDIQRLLFWSARDSLAAAEILLARDGYPLSRPSMALSPSSLSSGRVRMSWSMPRSRPTSPLTSLAVHAREVVGHAGPDVPAMDVDIPGLGLECRQRLFALHDGSLSCARCNKRNLGAKCQGCGDYLDDEEWRGQCPSCGTRNTPTP